MFPKILVGAPIRNSAKTIPYYLKAIMDQSYPKNRLEFCFLLDQSSTDYSQDMLVDFVRTSGFESSLHLAPFIPGPTYSKYNKTTDRRPSYQRMAKLRNILLDLFLKTDAEYLLSIDSDIIMNNRTFLNTLVDDNVPIVAGFIRNDYHKEESGSPHRGFNVMIYNPKIAMYVHKILFEDGLNECDLTGAIILIKREVIESGVRFDEKNPGLHGEDQSFCEAAKFKGFSIYVDTRVKCYHAMTEKQRDDLKYGRFVFKQKVNI